MFDLHSVLGLYAALILLVCALTGLMWSFQWYRDIVSFIFDAEVKRGAPIWKIVRAFYILAPMRECFQRSSLLSLP